jgi:hypothetical protein
MPIYVPFGKDCVPAFALKNANLRNESLPFDWLLAEPHLLKKSLDNNFSDWFDQDKLFNQPELIKFSKKYATAHKSYLLTPKTHSFFAHANLKDLEVCEKFKKRIARFYEIVNSTSEVVFVTSASYKEFKENNLLNYFNREEKTRVVFIDNNYSSNGCMLSTSKGYLSISYGGYRFDQNTLKNVGLYIKNAIEN